MSEKRSIGNWLDAKKKVGVGLVSLGLAAGALGVDRSKPEHTDEHPPTQPDNTPDTFNTYQYFETELATDVAPPPPTEENTLSSAERFLQNIASFDREHPEAFEQELTTVFEQFFSDMYADLHTYFDIDLEAATIQFNDTDEYLVHGTIELSATDSSSAQQLVLEIKVLSNPDELPILGIFMKAGNEKSSLGVSSQEQMFTWVTEQIVLPSLQQRASEQFADEPDPEVRQRLMLEDMRDQAEDILDREEYPPHILAVWHNIAAQTEHALMQE